MRKIEEEREKKRGIEGKRWREMNIEIDGELVGERSCNREMVREFEMEKERERQS